LTGNAHWGYFLADLWRSARPFSTTKPIVPQPSNPTSPGRPGAGPERFLRVDHLSGNLRGRSVRGGAVTIGNQGIKFLLALASMAVLARLLTPEDFGLIAMVMALVNFIAIFKDLGLSMATIQRAEVTHAQVSTLFWINVAVSVLIMFTIAALSPVLAWWYKEPRVTAITLALAGSIIFSGLAVQHQALLRRQMRFGLVAVLETAGILVSFVSGIAAALSGWGYWSLVVVAVVREIAFTLGVWTLCRWRPGMPVRRSGARELVSFGAHLTGFNVVNYVARNLDKFLIGRSWGAIPLGFYNKAYQMLLLPIQQINNPITGVAVPTLSRVQGDIDRYRAYYRRGVFLTVTIGMPVVAFLFVTAEEAVLTLLGDQWLACVPIFRALGPAAFVGTFNMATGWVYLSLGQTRRQFAFGIFGSIVTAAAFVIGNQWEGIGVALAYSVVQMILFPLAIVYCFRTSPLRVADFVLAVWRPAVASIVAGAALYGVSAYYASIAAEWVRLSVDFGFYAVFYILIWIGLPHGRRAAGDVIRITRDLRPGAASRELEP
jgi:O-antigen/teichoic acid export membrane protein